MKLEITAVDRVLVHNLHTSDHRRTCYVTSLLRHSQAGAIMRGGKTNQAGIGGRWAVLITALTPSALTPSAGWSLLYRNYAVTWH